MRRLGRWAARLAAALLLIAAALAAPSLWVEATCRGEPAPQRAALIEPEHRRAEARTLLTYPEWHIVHAYDDYARVIATDDPHDYGYLRAIGGFWSSFCALSREADALGTEDGGARQTVHVIGVSFTAELLAKAAYEETLGRLATLVRGPEHAPLDRLSAEQAAEYATFLQQVPWYRWDFDAAADALGAAATGAARDRERLAALGLEYRAKAAYARAIARAVEGVGADAPTLRLIAEPGTPAPDGATVVDTRPEGVVMEVPRYRALTRMLVGMAAAGGDFVEIAGNDDILVTTLSEAPAPGALATLPRQGSALVRNLHVVKVPALAAFLREAEGAGLRVEHIHDY